MYKIGYEFTKDEYTDVANWCNANPQERATIEQTDDNYVIVRIPEPTQEEKGARVKEYRNYLLAGTDKYMRPDFPITDEERQQIIAYSQYLRDYPTTENWYEKNPLTLDEWKKEQ